MFLGREGSISTSLLNIALRPQAAISVGDTQTMPTLTTYNKELLKNKFNCDEGFLFFLFK